MKHYEYEISLFVENELPPDKKEELFLHISGCKKCSKVLTDCQKLQYDISDFYRTLPSDFADMTPALNKKSIAWRVRFRRILIPVSVSVLILAAILFFMKPGLHKQGINSASNLRKEVPEKTTGNKDINLNSDSNHEDKIKHNAVNYLDIADFNEIINKTINQKEKTDGELIETSYNFEIIEFNKAINTTLYNNYD